MGFLSGVGSFVSSAASSVGSAISSGVDALGGVGSIVGAAGRAAGSYFGAQQQQGQQGLMQQQQPQRLQTRTVQTGDPPGPGRTEPAPIADPRQVLEQWRLFLQNWKST